MEPEEFEDTSFYRSYLLGPFSTDEWLLKLMEAESIFSIFEETHPELEVKRYTMVDETPDSLVILISIASRVRDE